MKKPQTIYISKGQYLSDLLDKLPSKSIIFKTLTGIGASTLEADATICKRNSILIEPNVPVIVGKRTKEIFGVSEGIYKEDVIDYLNSDVEYKKILVTPESYQKVKDAIEEVGMDLYNDFFLLFDECERTIQDVSYRPNIILPMDDFFIFKNSAFISATPIMPSDPRFTLNKFKPYYIKPNFDTPMPIDLIPTNNILLSLKKYFKTKHSDHYFIFLNSTETIASVIKTLDIKSESYIFCARESKIKLKVNDIMCVSDMFDATKLKKYNFFSSRFFSAVDLKVDFKPNILIISDLQKALHSMVDPYTEVIQIVGRLRNGVKDVTHISNLKETLIARPKDQVLSYLDGCESAYNTIKLLRTSATTQGARDTLDECLKLVEFARFINQNNGNKNYYMVDNEIHINRVNGYYHTAETLRHAYEITKRFTINFQPEEYSLDDIKNNKLKSGISLKAVYQAVAESLSNIDLKSHQYNFSAYLVKSELQKLFPAICEAYRLLGYDKMAELEFKPALINNAVEDKKQEVDKNSFQFITLLKRAFRVGNSYSTNKIIKILDYGIKRHGLRLRPSVKLLAHYFDISPRTTLGWTHDGREVKGRRILRSKFV
ncbi:hypothetical protein [Mucilaginibacter sp.]|uniref:hypothetical protein n=1 Tax=Mucilaginibacter sp. TaxID=1882438 RepID=UPI0025F014C1|nr:hypothetical protein [Mucilaginibacter sp.]